MGTSVNFGINIMNLGSFLGLALAIASLTHQVIGCCEGNSCSCEPNCWERCFNDPPNSPTMRQAYIRIYDMAMGIRNLYAPCFKPHGTAYMLDADVPGSTATAAFQTYQYQRDLASIIGQVQPVGNDCNPFCFSKFHQNYAYYAWSWACQSRCQIFDHFNSPWVRTFTRKSSASWVGGGKILANHCFKNSGLACTDCASNELIIAFTNSQLSNFYPGSGWCNGPSVGSGQPFYCAAVGVGTANWYNMANLMGGRSGSIYLMSETNEMRKAASKINKCIHHQCCDQSFHYTWPIMNREAQSELEDRTAARQTFGYTNSQGRDPDTIQEYRGTYDDFQKNILDKMPADSKPTGPAGLKPVKG